ncbi:hypothetical protein BGX23_003603 [Mortierella sp. AD031]|nr:hypothetical protein BGX23_003603 [Mortierella sp. AD031]
MDSVLDYTPSGHISAPQTNTWIVHTKQAFPIQSQLFDLTGCKFKAVLKRPFQRRTASLSDSHRVIEVTAVVMANKWEESAEIRVDFMLESFKPQQPPLARLWNSQLFKDIEIRFTGGQFAPILVHKDVVLDAALKFLQVVHVYVLIDDCVQDFLN